MLLSVKIPRVLCMLLYCMMLLCQVQARSHKVQSSLASGACPVGSTTYLNFCYVLYITPKNWIDANAACQAHHGGHLLFVLSGSEAAFVSSLIRSTLKHNAYVWIGLHDVAQNVDSNCTEWKWSNNDTLRYRGWEVIPPTHPTVDHCGTLTQTSDYQKWKNHDCLEELAYVCKFKM